MAAVVLAPTSNLTEAEWLAVRKGGIGGSDAAAILGLSPYRSIVEVFRDKVTDEIDGIESEAMYWGTVLEDAVAQEFAKRTGFKVRRVNAVLQHPTIPYLLGNIDRQIVGLPEGPALLECKTTSAFRRSDWDHNQVPDGYYAQVQHYLAVTGWSQGWMAVLIGGQDFRMVQIPRNEEFIQAWLEKAADFWLCVETLTPPLLDGSGAAAAILRRIYPRATGEEIALPMEYNEKLGRYLALKEDLAPLEREKDRLETDLKAAMGTASTATCGAYRAKWSNVTSNRLDQGRLKAEHPEIVEQYTTQSVSRRFSVSPIKDKEA